MGQAMNNDSFHDTLYNQEWFQRLSEEEKKAVVKREIEHERKVEAYLMEEARTPCCWCRSLNCLNKDNCVW